MPTARVPVYRFYATYNSVTTEVFPIYKDLIFEWEKKSGDWQRVLKTPMKFQNRPSKGDSSYSYFKAIHESDPCSVITFTIKQRCNNSYRTYWQGNLGANWGKWDLYHCIYDVEVEPNDYYNCLLSDVEINILEAPTVVTAFYDAGSNADREYDRCRLFSEVINYLATETCPNITQVRSDFFEINPVGDASGYSVGYNYVTGQINRYSEMLCGQKSDFKDPISSNAATTAKTTWKKVMEDLKILFDVEWAIEGTVVRLEHSTYFSSGTVFDVTVAPYTGRNYKIEFQQYEYNKAKSPRYESWSSEDFGEIRLSYENACGSLKPGESEVKNQVKEFYLDLLQLRLNGTSVTNLNGIMLLACEYNASTNQYDVLDSNSELSLFKLLQQFHRWKRPQTSAVISSSGFNEDFYVYSSSMLKEQKPLQLMIGKEGCATAFNPLDQVKTKLGTGDVIGTPSYNASTCWLTVQVGHGVAAESDIVPSDLPSLAVWYKADAGVTSSGGLVSSWADQSGNSRSANQATGSLQPQVVSSVQNGKAGILFDGTDDMLSTASFQQFPSKRGSLYIVCKPKTKDASLSLDNGFDSPTDWSTGKWTVIGGTATFNSTGMGSSNTQYLGSISPSLVVGQYYELSYEVITDGGAFVQASLGSSSGSVVGGLGTGIYTEVIQCTGSATLSFSGSGSGNIEIDNVVIKPVYVTQDHLIGSYGTGVGTLWDFGLKWPGIATEEYKKAIYTQTYATEISDSTIGYNYRYDEAILISFLRTGDTAASLHVNGTPDDLFTGWVNDQPSSNPLLIGGDGVGAYLNGYIFEILLYDEGHTALQRQQVERYLMKKWALNMYT